MYETNYDPDVMIDLVKNMKPENFDRFETIAAKIMQPYPNSYTFTKALAEQIIMNFASEMNIAIVRPSIIATSYREPLPGYTDNVSFSVSIFNNFFFFFRLKFPKSTGIN